MQLVKSEEAVKTVTNSEIATKKKRAKVLVVN
ncbi:hypothetical protein, unlikely [Trypanosoma brucei brucei TREU927]|uniref:Uncharacterized protein n=1 Tax=Trypanosoma brucei brucei (strain 927/4 GUTat10.1) TaxID=185431 RepID=Q38FI1_TRYB2|nr:hypothetical protein, unlikely [Trypanosoma brucei brucei TREU927]EAN76439.1 hypothetical protein, unlikely [Trypanosoma brucei brucei TREU927]